MKTGADVRSAVRACSGFRAGRIMKQSERLMSLDALRGFDMLFIMGASLVVAVCGWPSAVTDAAAASMSHVAWDGFAHHDTIFPLFLFIAGVSFPTRSPSSVRRNVRGRIMPRSSAED